MSEAQEEELDKRIIRGTLNEPSRILADFLDEHSRGFYAGGTPKDAIRIREKYMHLIDRYAEQKVREARIDTLSDMIIECYDHDNPMEIAEELQEERRQLEAQLTRSEVETAEPKL